MNKYLILLGLVLLASLSFAELPPANWMQYVEYRYGCALEYNWDLFTLVVPDGCYIGDEEDWMQLDYYMDCMGEEEGSCMEYDIEDMYYAAECEYDGGPSTAVFRSAMASFNTNNYLFRSYSLRLIRGCLAGTVDCTCDREDIVMELNAARQDYLGCIHQENPRCWEEEDE